MKKNKILIVEDETNIADSVKLNLEAEGYEVEYTTDGQMGLHYARTLKPDLIILDIMLPKLDGFEVNKIIQKELSIPVIFLTAKSDELSTVLGLELGADDYISKPFSMRELVSRVKAVLRRLENTKSHSMPSQINNNPQKGKFINEFVNKEYCKENLRLTNQYKRYPHKCNHKEFVIGLIKVIEDNSKEYQTQGDWYAVRTLVEKYVFDFHEGCLHWHNLSEYTQDIIKTLAKSITYLSAYNNYKRDIVESLSKKNPLESRFLNRFRPQYSNAFDSVLNKNGKAIEGSSLDSRSGLNVSVDHETDWKTYLSTPKVEGVRVPNFTWFLSMSYYGNYFKIKLPKNW